MSLVLIMTAYKNNYYSVTPTLHLNVGANYPNSRASMKVNSDAPCLIGKQISEYFLM